MLLDELAGQGDDARHQVVHANVAKLIAVVGFVVPGALNDFVAKILKPMCWWSVHKAEVADLCHPEVAIIADKDFATAIINMCDSFAAFREALSPKEGCYGICDGDDVVAKLVEAANLLSTVAQPCASQFLQSQLVEPMRKAMAMMACGEDLVDFILASGEKDVSLKDVAPRAQHVVSELSKLAEIEETIEKAAVGQVAVNRSQYIFRRCHCLQALASMMTLMVDSGTGPQACRPFSPLTHRPPRLLNFEIPTVVGVR